MSEITKQNPSELVDAQSQRIVEFLKEMGLPSEGIIASATERAIIGKNLPDYISQLPAETKRDATYLSRFVVGAGIGLFDYSLNSIWNEVVIDLRKKVIMYGIDIFFDAAVGGGKNRDFYKTPDDLSSIKDAVLLDTIRKLELISDTTYKKLKHVLDMRNDVGISHPTTATINAFELLGWLQTCVQDVLNDKPTEAAVQVQTFVANLKTLTNPIDGPTKQTVERRISELPSTLCGNLLRTVFGIFVSPDTDPGVRKNISLIAPCIWNNCIDEPKYKLGIVLEGYKSNLRTDKHELGEQFFEIVKGNNYRSDSERLIILDQLISDLTDKHNGWDNFSNEGPVADEIASYIHDQGDILPNLSDRLFKAVLICRIGRGVSYLDGVSPRGKQYYDHILALAGDKYAPTVMAALTHYEIQHQLSKSVCRAQAKIALQVVRKNVINARLGECLDYLIANIETSASCTTSPDFKKLSATYINWT